MDLRDKVVVLTAAGGGIGRSVARIFGRSGSHVVVSDRDSAAARAVADEIVAGGVGQQGSGVTYRSMKTSLRWRMS